VAKEPNVVWQLAAVCLVGLLLGLKFRTPALLVATLLPIALAAVEVLSFGRGAAEGLFLGLLYVLVLHLAYLLSVFLRVGYGRASGSGKGRTGFIHRWRWPLFKTPDRTR
jgi:hypothetical protein